MSSPAPRHPDRRPWIAALFAVVAALLFALAMPRPGVRVRVLRPVSGSATGESSASPLASLRVATYNLEHFTDGRFDGPAITPAAVRAQIEGAAANIAEADPDILVLEEVENARILRALNDALPVPYPYVYVTSFRTASGARDSLNHALLSRVPPVEVRQISFAALPPPSRPARGSLAARFALAPGRHLLVYALHLKSNFGDPPRNQAQRAVALHALAADAINERLALAPAALSVLLLGDTNVDPETPAFADDPSLAPLAGEYADLWLGTPLPDRTTIPTRLPGDPALVFPPSAFDRVFASLDLVTPPPGTPTPWHASRPTSLQRGCATHDNTLAPGHGGHVSDHYLVSVTLSPAPPPPPPTDP